MPVVTRYGRVVVISPEGDINHHEMACVKNAVSELMRRLEARVVVDLSEVDHINYMTLGVLVERAGRLRRVGGDLRLAAASPYLEKILRFTGVHHLFATFDTVEEAVASYLDAELDADVTIPAGMSGTWVPQMQ